jgi:hypothetical protein
LAKGEPGPSPFKYEFVVGPQREGDPIAQLEPQLAEFFLRRMYHDRSDL